LALERVRAILDAAETSAADIDRAAEQHGEQVRSEAQRDATRTHEEAVSQARDFVGRLSEASATAFKRIDALEAELAAFFETIRQRANRVATDVSAFEGSLDALYAAAGASRPAGAPGDAGRAHEAPAVRSTATEPEAPSRAAEPEAPATPSSAAEPQAPSRAAEPEAHATPSSAAEPEQPGEPGAPEPSAPDDAQGARLVALNMALDGESRAEADRYVADNFSLHDRERLLDEIYTSVQG